MLVQPQGSPMATLESWLTGTPVDGAGGGFPQGGLPANDGISRLLPPSMGGTNGAHQAGSPAAFPWLPQFGDGNPLASILNSLMQVVGALMQLMGGTPPNGPGTPPLPGNETAFNNATASSTGDPHLAFNGTASDGSSENAHWDSMAGHADLLDSDSIPGGFQISTTATPPNAQGISWNQNATVTTNNGATQVTLDAGGNASIVDGGQQYRLSNGQSATLSNGETVTRNADGYLAITATDGQGGSITTTLSDNGTGVDVHVSAQGVDLGGDLVNQTPAGPTPPPTNGPFPPIHIIPPWRRLGNAVQGPPTHWGSVNLE